MNERIQKLRDASFDKHPTIDIERAVLETEFYRDNEGKLPMPVLRAANFKNLYEKKTIYIGDADSLDDLKIPFLKLVLPGVIPAVPKLPQVPSLPKLPALPRLF